MDVRVYPGKYHKPYFSDDSKAKVIYNSELHVDPPRKTVAFDLDETLGNFSDLYILWGRIPASNRTQSTFDRLLEIYPEFLRIGILNVLRFVQTKIKSKECHPIYIYTNNQCGTEWVEMIVAFFEMKTGVQFARPICAYKIGKNRIEPKRTTHDKTYRDFVKCSMLQMPFEMCFVDDRNHAYMRRSKVYYIQPPPYFHPLTNDEIEMRFNRFVVQADPATPNKISEELFQKWKQQQNITNKIMYYLREFFLMTLLRSGRSKTKRNRKGLGTRKRY
jgi:hypothetical protein